jgi:hypothetical protein
MHIYIGLCIVEVSIQTFDNMKNVVWLNVMIIDLARLSRSGSIVQHLLHKVTYIYCSTNQLYIQVFRKYQKFAFQNAYFNLHFR